MNHFDYLLVNMIKGLKVIHIFYLKLTNNQFKLQFFALFPFFKKYKFTSKRLGKKKEDCKIL